MASRVGATRALPGPGYGDGWRRGQIGEERQARILRFLVYPRGCAIRPTMQASVGRRALSPGGRFSLTGNAAARLPRPGAARRAFAWASGNAPHAAHAHPVPLPPRAIHVMLVAPPRRPATTPHP